MEREQFPEKASLATEMPEDTRFLVTQDDKCLCYLNNFELSLLLFAAKHKLTHSMTNIYQVPTVGQALY